MAKKNNRSSAPAGKATGAQVPADMRRFLPCADGSYAYLVAGATTVHRKVADLGPEIDAWLEVVTGAHERDILVAQASELDAAYPGKGWDGVVAHLTAEADEPVAA